MIYPRKEAKSYGTGAEIEGGFAPGERAVVIDDLATTGGSKFEAIEKLAAAGLADRRRRRADRPPFGRGRGAGSRGLQAARGHDAAPDAGSLGADRAGSRRANRSGRASFLRQ